MPLIAECRVDGVHDCLIKISVGIDNHGIFAAHLADNALQFVLARAGFASRLPNSQPDLTRTRESNHFNIVVIDQMGADDRTVTGKKI